MSLLPAPSEWKPLEERFHNWEIVIQNPPIEGPYDPTLARPGAPVIQEDEVPRHSPKGGAFRDFMTPSPGIAFYADGYTYDGYGWRQEIPETRVLSLWSNISITETHEGIRTQIEVNAEEPAIPLIQELVTDFVFYRDGEKLYRLRCVDSEDILTRDAATVRFDCVSYDKLFERRILHEDWILKDGDINCAWRLIDYTQKRDTFGVSRGTKAAGDRRERALDAGDDILSCINDFAQSDGGYDWWIDAELRFWAVKPRRGKPHSMMWILGGEVAEMTRINPIEDYASLIMATGANSEIRIPREVDATDESDTSKARRDAPHINEDEIPEFSPTGAGLKRGGLGFISSGGRGLATYRDGFVYDGKGWRNPSGVPTDYLGNFLKAGTHRVRDIQDGAPRLAEEDVPKKSPTGAKLKDNNEDDEHDDDRDDGYRPFPHGRGLATYTDGFVFDGLTWRNSSGKVTYDNGEIVVNTKIVEDVYPPPNPQIVQLGNKPLGLWELTTSDTDVITPGALREKARWHLGDKGKIRPTYKLMLEPGVWTPNYALGDTFTLRIDTVRANVKVLVRIEELSITCSSDGAETVALAVRAEKPETLISDVGGSVPLPQLMAASVEAFADDDDFDAPEPNGRTVARHRLTETDDLGAILRSFRKRLDRIERSRGVGGGGGVNIIDGEGPPTCTIGSPGDYYVDTLDWRLYGPKADGDGMLSPPVTWDFREVVSTPNDRLLDSEVGWVGYVFEDVDIVGFRFDGLTCGVTDSFDRDSGALGPNWVSAPAIPAWNTANHDLVIASNAAVGTVADATAPASVGNTMRWAHPQSTATTQSIEVFVDLYQFWNSSGGYVYLFTNSNGANGACILVEVTHANYDMPSQPQNPVVRFTAFEADGTAHSETETIPLYFGASIIRLRLESDPGGENRLYYDTTQHTPTGEIVLLKTWQSPISVVGPYVGFGTVYGDANGFPNSPKFNAVTIGCPGAGVIGTPNPPPTEVSGIVTVSVWDWDRRELLFRTTAPAGGTGWVDIPPVRFSVAGGVETTGTSQRWCVSIGGAAVPVRNPGNQFIYDSFPPLVGSYGAYTGPVGSSPEKLSGYFGPFPLLYIRFQSQKCFAAVPEDVDSFTRGVVTVHPDKLFAGEIGKMVTVYNAGWLLGWRYKRMPGQTSPTTWTVWKWEYRYYSEVYANVKPFSTGVIAQFTDTYDGEGEYEIRLPDPILMDPFSRQGPDTVVISAGGQGIGIDTSTSGAETNQYAGAGWYNYHFGFAYWNATIGKFPQDAVPGSTYPNYYAWPMVPIMQRGDVPAWPTTDLKRSGSTNDPEGERAELHHNINYSSSGADFNGLRFYQGGPSHDPHGWGKGEGVPWWSTSLVDDGYSGIAFYTDDWYDEEYGVVWPAENRYTNKWAYYTWYYDYQYWEQWADLDPNNPYWPGEGFGTWGESGAWDDDAYWAIQTEGPHGVAGFHAESSGVGPMVEGGVNETTDLATMWSSSFDGIGGTQLSVTPRVIQACFQPEGTYNTWWYGDGSTPTGLTPKGCVTPLITAAADTATAADEPWQKQFFRQIGTSTVAFEDGLGQIRVPTGMAQPCVVNAQVDGVTAGGHFVVQARRVSQYLISVALNTAFNGDVEINWSVDAAAVTFGTPPPSIDTIRNPGSMYAYGPKVEYDAGGGPWPFELVSWGNTFVDGCVLKDFTGATVGGPFTVEVIDPAGLNYQRVLWDAGRDWYLPDQIQQYRMTNPDGQTSSWNVITWYEEAAFRATLSDSALRTTTPLIAEEQPEGVPAPSPTRYANNPRLQPAPEPPPPAEPVAQPLAAADEPVGRGPDSPRERRVRLSGAERKEQREARQERQRQERAAKRAAEEPPPETTEQ